MNSSLRLLASVLALGALAACATEHAPESAQVAWQGVPPVARVTTTEQSRIVHLSTAGGTLSAAEQQGLNGFIAEVAAGTPDNVHLVLRTDAPPAALEALRRDAIGAGVQPTKIELAPPDTTLPRNFGQQLQVEVVASVSRVALPSCPRVSVTGIIGNDNPDSSNWGCASVSNLEAQVADPRDLVQGEAGGATSGILTSAAIDRLNSDKLKTLPTTATSSVATAGGP